MSYQIQNLKKECMKSKKQGFYTEELDLYFIFELKQFIEKRRTLRNYLKENVEEEAREEIKTFLKNHIITNKMEIVNDYSSYNTDSTSHGYFKRKLDSYITVAMNKYREYKIDKVLKK